MSQLKPKRLSFQFRIQCARTIIFYTILLFTTDANIVEDPSCPCLQEKAHINTPKREDGTCLQARISQSIQGAWESFCYPLSYGTNCARHDENIGPFCSDSNRKLKFCDEPWCFVDPTKCKFSENNTYVQSGFFPELYMSYTTCGVDMLEFDQYESLLIANRLQGKTLRVGVPSILYPDHYKLDANGTPIDFDADINAGVGDFKGMYIDLLNDIATQANFTVVFDSVSAGSRKKHEDEPWTSCTQDVGRGLLDMCIGNFWETVPRRQMSQFSTHIISEVFYMIVPLPKEVDGIGAQMGKLFQPFTPTLWFTILLATIGVGFSYTLLGVTRKSSMKDVPAKTINLIYRATMELMSGASFDQDCPIYYKSVTLTWAFFVLIIVAAYTANLAAFLSEKKVIHKVVSVSDCIKKSCNLCYDNEVILDKLKIIYPSLRRYQSISSNLFSDALAVPHLLANGTCDVYIQSKLEWDMNPNFWGDCETMFLGNFVFDFKVSWPVTSGIAAPISFWLGKSVGRGRFSEIIDEYKPMSHCDKTRTTEKAVSSAQQIGVTSMAGPLLILAGGIAFGLFYRFGIFAVKQGAEVKRRLSQLDSSKH